MFKKTISKDMTRKPVYLLGADKKGIYYWLGEPDFYCGWYWWFGFVETYTCNEKPNLSLDIKSNEHAIHFYKEWAAGRLVETTFSDEEKWALCELFDDFYLLRDLAEAQYREDGQLGHYTNKCHGVNFHNVIRDGLNINRDCIPFVMAKIVSILSGQDAEELEKRYKEIYKKKCKMLKVKQ